MKPQQTPTKTERLVAWIGSSQSLVVHSLIFLAFFILTLTAVFPRDLILLIWNTIVSLEAIYLAIFIQITVNRQSESLREVEEDIEEIQEDVEELGEDVGEIHENIEEIQEDVEEMSEEDAEEETEDKRRDAAMDQLTQDVKKLLSDLEALKQQK